MDKIVETKINKNGYKIGLVRKQTYSAVLILEDRNGVSLQNEYGGYTTSCIGNPKYVEKRFKKM